MSTLTEEELTDIYEFAIHLGKTAGQLLLDGVNKRCGDESTATEEEGPHVEKENAVDLVTQTDLGM